VVNANNIACLGRNSAAIAEIAEPRFFKVVSIDQVSLALGDLARPTLNLG
jgi:hypothetical protein